MTPDGIRTELEYRIRQCEAFSVQDILMGYELQDADLVIRVTREDGRFVAISGPDTDTWFVPRITLIRRLLLLNAALARSGVFVLNDQRVAAFISGLRREGAWAECPPEVASAGEALGFISRLPLSDHSWAFPLARLLSFAKQAAIGELMSILDPMLDPAVVNAEADDTFLDALFLHFGDRVRRVVKMRSGLGSRGPMTLEQVALEFGITRERIRQIEWSFWNKVEKRTKVGSEIRRAALIRLLAKFIASRGQLLIPADSRESRVVAFLARLLSIPTCTLASHGIRIVGSLSHWGISTSRRGELPLDQEGIVRELLEDSELILCREDLLALSDLVRRARLGALSKALKVRLALEKIGSPAHYSEITEAYNDMWSDTSSEHSVHAILSREQDGVTWIGVRGTFALAEWGWTRPDRTLFEAVVDIVERIFGQTHRPVPFTAIEAEIGRYRQVVRHGSLVLATIHNAEIVAVAGNCYVPANDNVPHDSEQRNLDDVLSRFEKRVQS